MQKYDVRPVGENFWRHHVPESVRIAMGFPIAALHHAGMATLAHTPNPISFLNKPCERPGSQKPVTLLVVAYPKPGCLVPVHGEIKMPLAQVARGSAGGRGHVEKRAGRSRPALIRLLPKPHDAA